MLLKKTLYSFLLWMTVQHCVMAQDIHFSQFYLSPLTLNPANTGNYKGGYRFFGNYRSQWRDISKAYNTYSAGGDANFYPGNVNLSAGLLFVSDKSGGNLNVNKILPSGAWHFKLAGFKFHLGVQPGLVTKSINFNAHSFPNQLNWGIGSFDNTLPNNEANQSSYLTFLDLNSGIAINKRFGKIEPEIGYALFHINQPNESFVGNAKNKLSMRQAYNLGLKVYMGEKVIVHGYSLYGYTSLVSDWVSGLNLEYILTKTPFYDNSVYAGFMWRSGFKRNPDAGIITAGINFKNWTFGLSYDVTFSQLKTSVDSKGAYEMAFIYHGKSARLTQRTIPCERY
ncbi:MAG: PorP/SprF family type IX secretion system membrane protein [Bacteroidia bacterium]|nr:PorP/SprF family type IX secretion system membrane protein [Bacteroidia bacterium]